MTAAKTPPDRVRLTPAQMTRALDMCRERLSVAEKRERALRAILQEVSECMYLSACDGCRRRVKATLAAADEGEKKP